MNLAGAFKPRIEKDYKTSSRQRRLKHARGVVFQSSPRDEFFLVYASPALKGRPKVRRPLRGRSSLKADLFPVTRWWGHELSNRIKDNFELAIVLAFEFIEAAGEFDV
jgi:hypothetical protein